MNGSCNDEEGVAPLFDQDRMKRLFEGLRREALERAPAKIRESVVRVVNSLEADSVPRAEDLAVALMWSMDRRAQQIERRRRKSRTKKDRPTERESWAGTVDGESPDRPKPRRRKRRPKKSPHPPKPRPSKPRSPDLDETAFARRLDAQEEKRSSEDSVVRRMARKMGVRPSRVRTDASGRRVKILGDPQ